LKGVEMKTIVSIRVVLLVAAFATVLEATAADLTVRVSGINSASGQIGCALFRSEAGFPMNPAAATQQWMDAATSGVECRFRAVPAGEYAISVSHDLNGNRSIDTNFFAVPTEAWGVSNNARPLMRAPQWKEAMFAVVEGKDLTLDIKVAK
jgi:uncharacterized protein (DUF2141 family)